MQGSTADQGCSSSHDMLGITSVPAGPGAALEGGDQSGRAALHRFDLRGAVDEQHAARLNTEGVELGDQLGLRNGLLWHGESYHRPHQSRNSGGRKTPTAANPLERRNLTASSREVAFEVRQGDDLAGAQVDQRAGGRTRVGGRDSGQQPLATGAPQGSSPQAVVGQRPAVSAVQAADIDLPALTEGQHGDSHVLAIG